MWGSSIAALAAAQQMRGMEGADLLRSLWEKTAPVIFGLLKLPSHRALFSMHYIIYRLPVSTSLSAEWSPPESAKWEEKDFESDLKKLEKEAEERLDAKISEMMSKVESTGAN